MDTLKFEIPGKPEYLRMVRLAISSVAATAGFDVEEIDDLKNAVCEACKNVSCHGFSGFSDLYEIELKVDPHYMQVTVRDECDRHTLEKMSQPCRRCPQEGDLGVYVIESLMNQVEFTRDEHGRKVIRMLKEV